MEVPVRKLLKSELIWLGENLCRHGHCFLSHYNCFITEEPSTAPMQENIGIFDIKTTGLKANWSHMLAWCMKEHGKKTVHSDLLTRKEVRDKNDERIVRSAIKEIEKYDRVVTYYGTRFDIPYTRSRAIYHGIEFPEYRDLYHTDLYFMARSKFCLSSNRLKTICEFFNIPAKDHPMTPELWQRAGAGEEKALNTILTNCKEDVDSTDKVFNLLLRHIMVTKRSI